MANEFGTNDYGEIDCEFTFTRNMMFLCGKKFTISEIEDNGEVHGLDDAGYSISMDMLEEVGWFTTAEAFERLGANHERRFKRVSDGLVIDIRNGKYHWKPWHEWIGPNDEWKEILQDKEVSFTDAVKALDEGKEVYSKVENGYIFPYHKRGDNYFKDNCGSPITYNEILNGHWFIKA